MNIFRQWRIRSAERRVEKARDLLGHFETANPADVGPFGSQNWLWFRQCCLRDAEQELQALLISPRMSPARSPPQAPP